MRVLETLYGIEARLREKGAAAADTAIGGASIVFFFLLVRRVLVAAYPLKKICCIDFSDFFGRRRENEASGRFDSYLTVPIATKIRTGSCDPGVSKRAHLFS